VLDIGCGVGRWADELAPRVAAYLGTDFCAAYVSAAQQKLDAAGLPPSTHRVQCLAAEDLVAEALAITPPFDLVIIAGLLTFLNDDDVRKVLAQIPFLTHRHGLVYVREPVGLESRLTLQEHFSEELADYYHAVYRSVPEYNALFREALGNFEVVRAEPLFPAELCNRKETAQHIFVLRVLPER
jgi:cyclopropane fatty-acyl-phospholipid synthase-like methyltransferase